MSQNRATSHDLRRLGVGYDHLPFPLRTLSVGTRPVSASTWIELGDPDWAGALAAKADVLREHWADAVAIEPGHEAAQVELLEAVLDHLGTGDPGGDEAPIVRAARLVPDDLCLLEGAGYRLTAGVVAFPNRWRVPDKLGRSPLAVHEPVAGYAAALGAPVDRLLAALRPARILERRNWSLLDDPELFQPAARPPRPLRVPDGIWLRVERQTLRRLPRSGAVVFTIRTRQWPLGALADRPDQRVGLADALRSLPPDLAAYKGVEEMGPAVLAWLGAQ